DWTRSCRVAPGADRMSGALDSRAGGRGGRPRIDPPTTDGFPGRQRVIARKGQGKMDRDDPAYRGQAGYNPFLLAIYDAFVLCFMARVVWRCPTPPVVERHRQHLGRRHLDVGPGTGYFIGHARLPAGTKVTLLDPNPNVLARSGRRLAAMHPTTIEADVMKPLPVDGPFDSAALNYVLHCLRGPQSQKAVAIRNIPAVLEPERGVVRRHGLGNGRTTHAASSHDPLGLQPEGRLQQPRGYRRRAPRDPGGVVPDGGGRRDRIGCTLHGHRPTPGRVTERPATSPARCDPLKGATSDRPRSPFEPLRPPNPNALAELDGVGAQIWRTDQR